MGLCKGPAPGFIRDYDHGNPLLNQLVSANPDFCVICRDEDAVERDGEGGGEENMTIQTQSFKKPASETTTLISIRNSKGIEYEDVVIVNFFSTIPDSEQQWWKQLFANLISDKPMEPERRSPQMEAQLKLLYTAVTRCCNRLVFVETKQKPAVENFFRWLASKELAEPYTTDIIQDLSAGAVFYTHDEWKSLGIRRAVEAYGADSTAAITMLQTAIDCFKKAGSNASATDLLQKAKFNIKYEHAKREFLRSTDVAEVNRQTQEGWSDMILACIEKKMYREACEFSDLIRSRNLDPPDCTLDEKSPSRPSTLFKLLILSILDPLSEKV